MVRIGWRRCVGVACLSIAAAGSAAAQGSTVINFEVTLNYDRLAPDPRPNLTNNLRMSVTLTGKDDVGFNVNRNVNRRSDSYNFRSTLGPSGERVVWRAVGDNTLRGTIDMPSSVRTITITTSGSSCQVSLDDQLKPGKTVYNFKRLDGGGIGNFTKPRVVGSTCRIQ